ncbi:methionine--tRNA ligase subunit beta [Candidatus Micrarchaeota archaeon]|nr:methionine--tRNA ligase subunit beta [Candidatus Micrarchaeota archaeon]
MDITYSEFKKISMRTAIIKSAEKIEGYDKLLKLKIDLGTEERILVAGIAKYYAPDELLGKEIIVVANLEPKTIAGITSQGMLLAVLSKNGLSMLTTDKKVEPGLQVL